MYLFDKIIKSEDINLVEPKESVSGEFIRVDFESEEDGVGRGRSRSEVIQAEIEIARKEAYERGFSGGKKEGIEIEKRKVSLVLNDFRELSNLKKKILVDSEEEILNLAVSVAGKVIQQEVSTGRDIILNVLKEAIKNVLDKEEMKIRLNPKDYIYMMEVDPGILRSFDDIKNVSFKEDEGIEQGGAVIETLFGEVDARLEQQLREIRGGLKVKG